MEVQLHSFLILGEKDNDVSKQRIWGGMRKGVMVA